MRDYEPTLPASAAPAYSPYSPVGQSHTIAGKSHVPMTKANKQIESYSTPHSAAGGTAVLPTNTTIMYHNENPISVTSHVFPVTTNSSVLTQADEISQVSDGVHHQLNTCATITKDVISEYLIGNNYTLHVDIIEIFIMSSVVKCQHCLLVLCLCNYVTPPWYKASGSDLAAPVLAGPFFLKSKNKIPFLNLASNKQKCYCDFWTCFWLIISSYNRYKKHIKRCKIISHLGTQFIFILTRY